MKKSGRQPRGSAKTEVAAAPVLARAAANGYRISVWAGVLAAILALAVWQWFAPSRPAKPVPVAQTDDAPQIRYVANEACKQCHEKEFDAWKGSHHDKAMAHATSDSVLGNFNNTVFKLKSETSRFFRRGDQFFVNTRNAEGKLQDFELKYTFGVDPLQQYLIEFPGGRLQALPIAWDTRKKRWFHLYPETKIAGDDPLHWTGRYQNWNLMCADCHSTNLRKGYDERKDAYETRWDLINVSCQSCHGPGEAHVIWAEAKQEGKPIITGKGASHGLLVDYRKGDSRYEVDSCGACHSRRQRLTDGDLPGAPYLDNYQPALLREGLYHPDGQQQDEVYVYGSMLQSRMHQKGVRCTDCHEAHTLKLKAAGNAVCAQCHSPGGNPRFASLTQKNYDSPEHHFHKAGSTGAQCANCHMPAKRYMVVHSRPDHSFRIPRPDLSVKLGTPNACNQCHSENSAAWATSVVANWYGPTRRQEPGFAEAFAGGRAGQPEAIPALMAIVRDQTQTAIVRATAVELLGGGDGIERAAVVEARNDTEALVRAAAVQALSQLPEQQRTSLLTPLLHDPTRSVRIEAARALASAAKNRLTTDDRRAYEAAAREASLAEKAMADMPVSQLNQANKQALLGNPALAREHFERTLKMDPYMVPARTAFAEMLSAEGDNTRAEEVLKEGLHRSPGDGHLHYSLGLLLAQSDRLSTAVIELDKAARLLPDDARIAYNHGLALQHLGRQKEAEKALLRAYQLAEGSPDVAYAVIALYLQNRQPEKANRYAERLFAEHPDSEAARILRTHLAPDRASP